MSTKSANSSAKNIDITAITTELS